ncbi:amidohydrolase family protein [Prescottella defluvii]|nr:amidohydrolase family protein [Prescottella defluvii]
MTRTCTSSTRGSPWWRTTATCPIRSRSPTTAPAWRGSGGRWCRGHRVVPGHSRPAAAAGRAARTRRGLGGRYPPRPRRHRRRHPRARPGRGTGMRFNLRRSATDVRILTKQALRAHELVGWHAEFYVDATLLLSLEPVFAKLPAVSIDHLGMSTRGLRYLLNLVDRGAKVKATGFGRTSIGDVGDVIRQIHAVNPKALMFGTDLPGTRARRAFEAADVEVIADAVGDDLEAVLGGNAREWYRCGA